METKFQETLQFCDANTEERRQIYENVGLKKVSMILGNNEKSAEKKAQGIDASALDEIGGRIGITEKICNYRYSSRLVKKIPVELYADFEEGVRGWARTSSADTVFYFFVDAVVSMDLEALRGFLDHFHDEESAETVIGKIVNALIEHNVSGKVLEDVEGAEVYISPSGDGHHSVGLIFQVGDLPDNAMNIVEYYFEEEEEMEEEPEPECDGERKM